jgi:SAM-dependent methyltransferase
MAAREIDAEHDQSQGAPLEVRGLVPDPDARRGPLTEVSDGLYAHRFSAADQARREAVWPVLCTDFFQRYVGAGATVIDVGAGDGLFLRNIRARRRIAVDTGERVRALADEGIEVRLRPADDFCEGLEGVADVVFLSNLLEHLPTKAAVVDVLRQCHQALRPNGRVIVLQPNVRYAGAAYWDYLDHQIALTDRSVAEALRVAGFELVELRVRFLPYTTASFRGLPAAWLAKLVRVYLRLPWLWRLFGAQSLLVGRPVHLEPEDAHGRP